MKGTLSSLLRPLEEPGLIQAGVIPWSSPVPVFGDPDVSSVATLGLNPSNREFVDDAGNELVDQQRRFHTLRSLGLRSWSEAGRGHVEQIADACRSYFSGNPYDTWFRRLDQIISGTGASYYGVFRNACHLDLIPYATARKWVDLSAGERKILFMESADALGQLLRQSPIQLLVLNGRSVVEQFEKVAEVELARTAMPAWQLPRLSGSNVQGWAYAGTVNRVAGVRLARGLNVVGYNHNIQSSFGVTRQVIGAIRTWIAEQAANAPQRERTRPKRRKTTR